MEDNDNNKLMVKICGLRRTQDVEYVNKYLPDYVGFVFADSKRKVTDKEAKYLINDLNENIKTVGVFVNEDLEKVCKTAKLCALDVVQIHGDEEPSYICALKKCLDPTVDIWKAIRVKDSESIKKMGQYNVEAFVLDAYTKGSYGGAGKTFDWDVASDAKNYGKIILAGGITIQNVSMAIKHVAPWALDVSSGVESDDGFKDGDKIEIFIDKCR